MMPAYTQLRGHSKTWHLYMKNIFVHFWSFSFFRSVDVLLRFQEVIWEVFVKRLHIYCGASSWSDDTDENIVELLRWELRLLYKDDSIETTVVASLKWSKNDNYDSCKPLRQMHHILSSYWIIQR